MASFASENMSFNNGDGLMNGSLVDVLKLSNVFLMSFLEDSQGGEEYNEEQLDDIIRSLEAETNQRSIEDPDSVHIRNNIELMDGEDCLVSLNLDHEFAWDDSEQVASSPGDHNKLNLYIDSYEMDCTVEFDEVGDYSQFYYKLASANQGCYSCLGHEIWC